MKTKEMSQSLEVSSPLGVLKDSSRAAMDARGAVCVCTCVMGRLPRRGSLNPAKTHVVIGGTDHALYEVELSTGYGVPRLRVELG